MSIDPYYDRLMALVLSADPLAEAGDPELVARLTAQTVQPAGYAVPDAEVHDDAAPGPHGAVPLRVYRPRAQQPDAPLLVWCHGGGWIGGDLTMPEADAVARELCHRAGATVVSVDYRLALEGVSYPVPLDDVVAAFRWAAEKASTLGCDRVFLGGASAGANLAAGATLRLRDEGGGLPAAVLLAYPCVHPVLPPPSEELAPKVAGLTPFLAFAPELLTPLVENYLGAPVSEATPYAMAALADLTGFPPTLIVNDEYDGLRSSGEAFAAQLEQAGVEVECRYEPGVAHGHLNNPWLDASDASLTTMASWLGKTRD